MREVLAAGTLWPEVIVYQSEFRIEAIKLLYQMKAAGIKVQDMLWKEIKHTSCSSTR